MVFERALAEQRMADAQERAAVARVRRGLRGGVRSRAARALRRAADGLDDAEVVRFPESGAIAPGLGVERLGSAA